MSDSQPHPSNASIEKGFSDAIRALMANQFALEVMVRSLVNSQTNFARVDRYAEMYAEAVRANLLGLAWSDDQIESFECSLSGLRMTLRPSTPA